MRSKLHGALWFATMLAGCSLFVSVDGLDDGGTLLTGDAGASEAARGDAPVDAVGPGADGAVTDAGGDACVFCDDFDNRNSLLGAWDNASGNGDITSATYKSAPNSAHFHLDPLTSGVGFSNLSVSVPLTAGATSVDLDVKVDTDLSGANGYVNILDFTLNGLYAGSFTASAGTWATDYWVAFPDGGYHQSYTGAGIAPDRGWHHIHYAIRYDLTEGTFAVLLDATHVATGSHLTTYGTSPTPPTVVLSVGAFGNASLPATDIYIDNVHVE